jgi:amino acid adenylation domain-containing protein
MQETTLQRMLAKRFLQHPDKDALVADHAILTYRELDQLSDGVARALTGRGIAAHTAIGVYLADRVQLIVTMLGIMKARCLFAPLDVQAPPERTSRLVRAGSLTTIITGKGLEGAFGLTPEAELLRYETLPQTTGSLPPLEAYSPDDPLYLYTTSGSTGVPKSILGRNGSLAHFIGWEVDTFGVDDSFVFGQLTIPTFDVFLRDVFVPLAAGATIMIPRNDLVKQPEALARWLESHLVSFLHTVPAILSALAGVPGVSYNSLKYILLAGEKLPPALVARWYRQYNPGTQLVNLYGPTETTLAKAFYRVRPADGTRDNIPIGKPISGARFIVLDDQLRVCPPMEVGEIFIRTPYRSYGYLNDPELNHQKFIPNPFGSSPDDLIYRTGDLGRLNLEGDFEIIGRRDRQVKIRGIRVEPEEIEKVLLEYPFTEEAAVVAKTDGENESTTLMACVVLKSNQNLKSFSPESNRNDLLVYLRNRLPGYLIPQEIVFLGHLPRKPNGKVDFDGLRQTKPKPAAPQTPTEAALLGVWKKILQKENVGVAESFFGLGGNSLNVMTLLYEVNKELDVRLEVNDFYENDTVLALAAKIDAIRAGRQKAALKRAETRTHYPLTRNQEQLYVSLQDADPKTYVMQNVVEISGDVASIDYPALVATLVNRHEGLRTYFQVEDDVPVQRVAGSVPVPVGFHPYADDVLENLLPAFDIYQFPLCKFDVVEAGPDRHLFVIAVHHLVSDALSQHLLMHEFYQLLLGQPLPAVSFQFKDYAQWEHRLLRQEATGDWVHELAGYDTFLNFPVAYNGEATEANPGRSFGFEVAGDRYGQLKDTAREHKLTPFTLVFTLYYLFISRITNQRKLALATPVTARNAGELRGVVGPCFSTALIPLDLTGNVPVRQLAGELQAKINRALSGRDFNLADFLAHARRTPLPGEYTDVNSLFSFDTVKNYDQAGAFAVKPYAHDKYALKYPFYFNCIDSEDRLSVIVKYDNRLFSATAIERLCHVFAQLCDQVSEDLDLSAEDLVVTADLVRNVPAAYNLGFNF